MEQALSSIHSEPKADALTGKHVRLWPYSRGYYPRDMVWRIWSMVERERAVKTLFWGRFFGGNDLPVDPRGDLQDFVEIFSAKSNAILIIVTDAVKDEMAGVIWFDDIIPKYRATANIFMRQKYWGAAALEAGHLALRYLFGNFDIQYVWCFTPWKAAKVYAGSLGFKMKAVFDDYTIIEGKERDIFVLRLSRGEYHG